MRQVIVSEFVTLDDVFEDPGGNEGTEHGGWNFKYGSNEQSQAYKVKELAAADALLLGRVTYEGFAEAWPKIEGAGEFGAKMNSMTKHVVTETLNELEWNNSHAITGDIPAEIKKLKAQPGQDILVFGSGQLVRYLLDHHLVDKLCLMVHPVVLGSGKQLLYGAKMTSLKLDNIVKFDTGTIVLEYVPT